MVRMKKSSNKDIQPFLANLSHQPGVYQMLGEKGEVIYVGKAKNLKKRVSSYFSNRPHDLKTTSLVKKIKKIEVIVTATENEAVLLEANLIKKYAPRYNVLLRDDKSYPYILITTQHEFPRIVLYRGLRKKNGRYFGPFPSSLAVKETISLLQKLFHLRTCKDSYFEARNRPCLLYQIGRCSGSCVGRISQDEYAHNVHLAVLFLEGKSDLVIEHLQAKMEKASTELNYELAGHFRDQIRRLRQIQERQYVNVTDGNADIIGLSLQAGMICIQLLSIRNGQLLGSRSYFPDVPASTAQEEIIHAFVTQHYLHPSFSESIPKEIMVPVEMTDRVLLSAVLSQCAHHKVNLYMPVRGDKKKWLDMASANAHQSLTAKLFTKANMQERLTMLKNELHLKKIPRRIECYDISHSMGEATVASCVVFDQAGPVKSDYRLFNIQNVTPGDDIAAMKQVILRRFKRLQKDEAILPDVVLIDGGKTQLAAANSVINELNLPNILLVGVSKGPGRKPGFETLHIEGKTPIHLPADSPALHVVQQIRDEAHRFAITGHRHRRDKARRQSPLEQIAGIGSKRRRDLLRYFGGIQGIAHASLDELIKVPGISQSIAERIFAAFHDTTI